MTEYSVETTSAAALHKLVFNQHDGVSCDNVQHNILMGERGGMEVLSRLPVTSETAKMAMYPVPSECLGPNDCYLKPFDKLPCNAHLVRAYMKPGAHVDIPTVIDMPVYRSLATEGKGSESTYVRPDITLPHGTCIEDSDGGKKMTFKTAAFAATDAQLAEMIEKGIFRNKQDYLLAMRDAAWKELKRQLQINGVGMHHLFECSGDLDADGSPVVSPEAVIIFMDLLYPCLIPGHDMILCLPPLVDDQLVMDAAFHVRFSYPDFRVKIPLLGTYHNDIADPSSVMVQDENLYILSNVPLDFVLPNDETGAHVSIPLHGASAFLPDTKELAFHNGKFSDPDVQSKYEEVISRDEEPDFEVWEGACIRFQQACMKAIYSNIMEAAKNTDMVEFSTEALFVTNLIGMRIPKATTYMNASMTRVQASASAIAKRMANKRAGPSATEAGGSSQHKRATTDAVDMDTMDALSVYFPNGGPQDSSVFDVMLANAVAKLRDVGEAGTQAMVVYMAKGQDPKYVTSDALVVDSVEFASMTDNHKAQMAQMITSLLK